MFSIKFKILIAYNFALGAILTIFAFIIYNNVKAVSFVKLDTNLKLYSLSLKTDIEDQLEDNTVLDINKLNSIHAKGLIAEKYCLSDSKGNIISNNPVLAAQPVNNSLIMPDSQFIIGNKNIAGQNYRVLLSSFSANNTVYLLETIASTMDIYDDLDKLLYLFIIIIPAGLMLASIVVYIITKVAFRPVTNMTTAARHITARNLDMRLDVPRTKDEISILAETLNEMIERIDNSFKSQKRFVDDASHEIRTPLTVIQTELEIIDKQVSDPEIKDGIKNALSEIDQLTKLTADLLTIAKLDTSKAKLELSPVRLDELLAECTQIMFKPAGMKDIQIYLNINDNVEIKADRLKLKSLFLNLLENAIKYSSAGSYVKINLLKKPDKTIIVSFENKGVEISNEELPFIFNRFYRSNEIRAEIKGSGLGLAIAKEIADLHNGEIKVESRKGGITVFSVRLPGGTSGL